MSMVLSEVLNHPSILRAEPTLLSGGAHLNRPVRWVHSSEVLDIGPLLRGGELLLTGGSALYGIDADRQRAYITGLAAHGVTAVAVETAGAGVDLPAGLVDEAVRQGFTLIQLDRTVPFVEITESINGLLVNDSVRRLRLADSLSDALSAQLTSGAEAQQLADTLAGATGAGVIIRETTGEPLATAPDPLPERAGALQHAPIAVHGVTTALLELLPPPEVDETLLEAALDRAPQAFGLALLRTSQPSPAARSARALLRALREPNGAELAPLIEESGLALTDSFAAVTATDSHPSFRGTLEQAMRRGGRYVLSQVDDHEYLALVALERHRPAESRGELVEDIREISADVADCPTIGVGPRAIGGERLAEAVTEARRCTAPALRGLALRGVVDSDSCSLHRLVHRLDADVELERFVDEHLGGLLRQAPDVRHRLSHTLEVFFDCAGNKTETAQRLYLRRQTLYQRLDKLSRLLGREVTDPASVADLQVAVRLSQVLQGRRRSIRS